MLRPRLLAIIPATLVVWLCISPVALAQDFEDLFQEGIHWQKAGEHRKATAAYEAALRVADGSEDNYEWALANLAQVCHDERAEPLLKEVIARRERRLGPNHDDVGKVVGDLGNLYLSQGKFKQGLEVQARAIAIRRQHHPIEAEGVLMLLEHRISVLLQIGEYQPATELAEKLLKELEARVGPNDARLRDTLNSLALIKVTQGKFSAADQLIQRVQRLPAPARWDSVSATVEATQLGGMLLEMGRPAEALPHFNRAERAILLEAKRNPGAMHNIYWTWACQAECWLALGQPDRARRLSEAAIPEIQAYNPRSAAPATYILGRAHQRLGQNDEAERIFRRMMKTEAFPEGNRVVAGTQLAAILAGRGETVEAEKLLLEALEHDRAREHDSAYLAEEHRLLAELYLSTGRAADAETHFRAGAEVLDRIEGQHLREQAANWLGRARALEMLGKTSSALAAADKARRLLHELTTNVLPALPESEQLAFLNGEEEPAFQAALALVRPHTDQQAVELMATWSLNRKGLAQQAMAQRILLTREAHDPALAALVDNWLTVRQRLAKVSVGDGSGKAESQDHQRLVADLILREQELARQMGKVKVNGTGQKPWYEIGQLRQALPASTVYVDLVEFTPLEKNEPAVYLAWIVPPENRGEVRLVELGSAEHINQCVADFRDQLSRVAEYLTGAKSDDPAGKQEAELRFQQALERLSDRLLGPLSPAIADFEHWVICPDGPPWLVPFSTLLLPGENAAKRLYAVEKHRISLVVSGRDLIESPSRASGNAAIILAAADFDDAPQDSPVGRQPIAFAGPNDGTPARGARGLAVYWNALPGTADEARFVTPSLTAYTKRPPQILLGARASEGALKDAWRPRVALLSTHGFFLEPAEKSASTAMVNPLLQCGLVLAGANQLALREQEAADDGIVTGLDVLSTDFRGTEMVVLSACETGLGQVQAGEGVAGLRQAFQLAGAQSVAATLWRIDDEETSRLMSMFFDRLAAGSDKAAALAEAQRGLLAARRRSGKSPHPYYWGAFTLTGNWRNLEIGPPEVRPPRPVATERVEVVVEQARVMDGSKLVTLVQFGDQLARGKSNGEWVQVYYEPGTTRSAWIRQSEVRPVQTKTKMPSGSRPNGK